MFHALYGYQGQKGQMKVMESTADQRHYEPQSAEELMKEFPDWSVSQGTTQLWYARYADSALVSGEDLLDLRDQIIKWIRQHDSR
jgi:hypothetical protein